MAVSAKSKKKPASKAVVGKPKHRSFRLTPKSFTIGLSVLVLVSAFGLLGFNKVKYGSFSAQAAGRTSLGTVGGVQLYACKNQSLKRVTFYSGNYSGTARSLNLQAPGLVGSKVMNNGASWTSSYKWNAGYTNITIGGYVKSVGNQSSLLGSFRSVSTANIATC